MNTDKAIISLYDGGMYLNSPFNPVVVDISYEGRIEAESALPSGFLITERNIRIMILRLSNNEMPDEIFSYIGDFKITRARAYKSDGSSVYASVDKISHKYRDVSDNWNQLNNNWVLYGSGDNFRTIENDNYTRVITSRKSKIITNNLHTDSIGNLYLSEGRVYKGDVNYDSSYGFYTGSSRKRESTPLKRLRKRIVSKRKLTAKNIRRKNKG